ncbi:MAG: hypothetical protein U5N58_00805 [Actinomycetota bacterium]|nr:hypothetical protein [Actinomycetota bacterium]
MELNLDQFIAGIKDSRKYSPIGMYPAMDMDIAIVVDQEVSPPGYRTGYPGKRIGYFAAGKAV